MRQLRIKIMNAPAAVTRMTIMAATAKSKYAVGRSSSSATSGSLWRYSGHVHKHHGGNWSKNLLLATSL